MTGSSGGFATKEVGSITSLPNMAIFGIYLNLQKVFDTTDHNILLYKLHNLWIRGVVHNWFRDYLHNRNQYVSVNGQN